MAKLEPKYFIGEYSLKDYCMLHGYSYASARNMISSNRRKHPEWTDDEILENVVKRLEKSRTKYYFAGTTLNKYCKEHGIVPSTARRIYQRLISSLGEEFSEEAIMKEAIELAQRGRGKYSIDGVKLALYCRENGINKGSVISSISHYRKVHPDSQLSDEKIAKEVLMHYRAGFWTYYVGSETFSSYVLRYGHSPSSVLRKILALHPEIKSSARKIYIDEECVQEVMNSMRPKNGTLYFYEGTTLSQYCLENGLNYESIYDTMTKNPQVPLAEIIEKAYANKARRVHQRDRISLKEKENDEGYVRCYIDKYGIDEGQFRMLREHFSPYVAISAIEYFGVVNEERVQEIFGALSREDKSLDDAILLVNLGYHDYAYHAVKKVEGLIINTIKEVITDTRKYGEYKEFLEEYIYTLLADKCYMFTPAGYINYLKKSLKYKLINHMKKEATPSENLRLAGNYSIDGVLEKREKIDMVREALNCLSEWELSFVYRRFGFQGENMSLDKLRELYYSEFSIEELKDIESSI
ncbi:MAG TPA: hypothetical protein DCY94_03795, partial [Firmicutes bacterium]|nr:hypothetical protein [Bacillota bacterium]